MSLITLTTDFGDRDWFVGVMKGVILKINPLAQIVDISHEIPAGDIRAGAFALASAYSYFPRGTIHLAIVDPGVGGDRTAIAVQTRMHNFVGPDNGLVSWAAAKEKIKAIHQLSNPEYFLQPVSQTFHGRDVFAPIAAHLSRGIPVKSLGRSLKDFVRIKWPAPLRGHNRIQGEVVYVDRFGNAITNIEQTLLANLTSKKVKVIVKKRYVFPLASHYEAVPRGQPVAVPGSSGFLEIALNCGSAADYFGLKNGEAVVLRVGG
jgi:S-adenosylmethionine hydrolase